MKIGVSECLLGVQCRYDGLGSKDKYVVEILQEFFEFKAYCPEKVIFGTPRDTIRQVEVNDAIVIQKSNASDEDVTAVLEASCNTMADQAYQEELCGFILKSKSPTCGMERVRVYQDGKSMFEKKGTGLFTQALRKRYPYLPIEEESRLGDAWLRENFLMQVFAYEEFHRFMKSNPKMRDLVAFHTGYKYLIYAKSAVAYKLLGNIVANRDGQTFNQIIQAYRKIFLETIALRGNIAKTTNVLFHIYGYFKKIISKEEKAHLRTAIEEFKEEIIPLIAVIKLFNLYVKRFDMYYLKQQKFLNPYPPKLALRSNVKAYR